MTFITVVTFFNVIGGKCSSTFMSIPKRFPVQSASQAVVGIKAAWSPGRRRPGEKKSESEDALATGCALATCCALATSDALAINNQD